jgi:hypothetical protein
LYFVPAEETKKRISIKPEADDILLITEPTAKDISTEDISVFTISLFFSAVFNFTITTTPAQFVYFCFIGNKIRKLVKCTTGLFQQMSPKVF